MNFSKLQRNRSKRLFLSLGQTFVKVQKAILGVSKNWIPEKLAACFLKESETDFAQIRKMKVYVIENE